MKPDQRLQKHRRKRQIIGRSFNCNFGEIKTIFMGFMELRAGTVGFRLALQTLLQCGLSPNQWVLVVEESWAAIFCLFLFYVLFIVTTAVQKLLFNLHRYMTI